MKKGFQKGNLLQKLTQFGLDPADWDLARERKNLFDTLLLINKTDPSLRLVGKTGATGWRQIQLLSI